MCFPTRNMHKPHTPTLSVAPLDTRGSSQMKPGRQDKIPACCQNTSPEPKPHVLLRAGRLVPGSAQPPKADQDLHCAHRPRPHQGQLCPAKRQRTQMSWRGTANLHSWGWAEVCSSPHQQGEMWESRSEAGSNLEPLYHDAEVTFQPWRGAL